MSYSSDDIIVLPVPLLLADEFVTHEAFKTLDKRASRVLAYGGHDLGFWRIEALATNNLNGSPRMFATLRRMYR